MSWVRLSPSSPTQVWGSARPSAPLDSLRVHKHEFAGESVQDKITRMRAQTQKSGAGVLLVTMLDEVAWLLNLRGSDVAYNPVFISYVIVTQDACRLYIDERKLTPEIKAHLQYVIMSCAFVLLTRRLHCSIS